MKRPFFKNYLLGAICLCMMQASAQDKLPTILKCGKYKPNDLKDENLKGRVKAVITEEYTCDTTNHYFKITTTTFYYDTSGMWTEHRDDYPSGGKGGSRIWKRIYSAHGDLIKSVYYRGDSTEYTDNPDNIIDIMYDSLGRLIEEKQFGTKWIYKYDINGSLANCTAMNGDEIVQSATYMYDDKCRLVQSINIAGTRTEKTINKYDLEGKLIETSVAWNDNKDKGSSLTKYKYDDHGNQTEYNATFQRNDSINPNPIVTNNSYKYDDLGNWFERIQVSNDRTLNFKNERQIIYY